MILTHECFINGTDAEFFVTFEYEPYRPAKIFGPPENCYPAEGGKVDLLFAHVTTDDQAFNILEILSQKTQDQLKDKCGVWAREAQSSGELR